jgi:hypothetical protein
MAFSTTLQETVHSLYEPAAKYSPANMTALLRKKKGKEEEKESVD